MGSVAEGGQRYPGAKAQAAAECVGVCGLWSGAARDMAFQSRRFPLEKGEVGSWFCKRAAARQNTRGLLEGRSRREASGRFDAATARARGVDDGYRSWGGRAGRASDCESRLAASLWRRVGANRERFWCSRRDCDASGIAGMADVAICSRRLEAKAIAQVDHDERGLSAGFEIR